MTFQVDVRIRRIGHIVEIDTDYINLGHSKDGKIAEQDSDVSPLLIQKLWGIRI